MPDYLEEARALVEAEFNRPTMIDHLNAREQQTGNEQAFHVTVPTDLVYRVEAATREEAERFVWAAIAPRYYGLTPVDSSTVCLLADKTEHRPPPYDVVEESDHGDECGCDQCVSSYDRD